MLCSNDKCFSCGARCQETHVQKSPSEWKKHMQEITDLGQTLSADDAKSSFFLLLK